MTLPPPSEHFQGKSALEHLKEARTKGMIASMEVHGTEMPGHLAAAADAAKETTIALVLLWVILSFFPPVTTKMFGILALFSAGWLIWKIGRSAYIGWARLERLHRLIEEERWEIEHHPQQEREELKELYMAKGFSGKMLDEVVDVLMADDNRLLQVMLEEELGLSLEAIEHPLKQSIGAGVGVLVAALLFLLGYHLSPLLGGPIAVFCTLFLSSALSAKLERNRLLQAVVWSFALALFAAAATYFLTEQFFSLDLLRN
jgi:hypothetical protein